MELLAMVNQYAIIFTAALAIIALGMFIRVTQLQGEIKSMKK